MPELSQAAAVKWMVDLFRQAVAQVENAFLRKTPGEVFRAAIANQIGETSIVSSAQPQPLPSHAVSPTSRAMQEFEFIPGTVQILCAPTNSGKTTAAVETTTHYRDRNHRVLSILVEEDEEDYFRKILQMLRIQVPHDTDMTEMVGKLMEALSGAHEPTTTVRTSPAILILDHFKIFNEGDVNSRFLSSIIRKGKDKDLVVVVLTSDDRTAFRVVEMCDHTQNVATPSYSANMNDFRLQRAAWTREALFDETLVAWSQEEVVKALVPSFANKYNEDEIRAVVEKRCEQGHKPLNPVVARFWVRGDKRREETTRLVGGFSSTSSARTVSGDADDRS